MSLPPPSPFASVTLEEFGARFRRGEISAHETAATMLARIEALEPKLAAFVFVDPERALAHAEGIDRLRAAGVDLGPLMGVPVAIKDLFSVANMPTLAGSRVNIADLVPAQGRFVTGLQRNGCIILGKTTTTEFALGGYNLTHRLPHNPCDPAVARMTGGSSHGSAVAMAAGLAGFTIGSDTGGSVRLPAALCGVVGYKTTAGHWPEDGIFPLSRHMDSIGTFTAGMADAALIHAALSSRKPLPPLRPEGLVLGLPINHFLDRLDAAVQSCFARALDMLRAAGARIVDIDVPEAAEIDVVFGRLIPAELIGFLGRDRFLAQESRMDPVAAARARAGLELAADEYVRLTARQRALIAIMEERSRGIDAWITPTVAVLPEPAADFRDVETVAAWNRLTTRNTRPGNLFGQCGVSLPIHHLGAALPVGLQLCGVPDGDERLLALANAVELVVGRPRVPNRDALLNG